MSKCIKKQDYPSIQEPALSIENGNFYWVKKTEEKVEDKTESSKKTKVEEETKSESKQAVDEYRLILN